jgi:hypothetical protein
MPQSGIRGCNSIERDISRNAVSRHNFLHVADIPVDIVPIVLARVLDPLRIIVVELALVICG